MNFTFYKYHGAGNDFILVDNRDLQFPADNIAYIAWLCDRRFGIGADGLMLLQNAAGYDFEMRYFNSDGREASMCGNGGRCITAFAQKLGLVTNKAGFLAVDGYHEACLLEGGVVDLKMSDVTGLEDHDPEFYLNTGSPHFVRFVEAIEQVNVYESGREVRYNDRFKAQGTNVNFVQQRGHHLTVYTYERGVEAETLACGTGITASALCAARRDNRVSGSYSVTAKGGELSVAFEAAGAGFRNIWLKGPAEFVFQGIVRGPA